MLTLIADASGGSEAGPVPSGYATRECRQSDTDPLGRLYFAAYDPGQACATVAEAAMLTVQRAPWPDTPDCPFVIELFTARAHRGRGLARWLVRSAMDTVHCTGEHALALRVASDNEPARGLYRSLGFRLWTPEQQRTG